MLMHLQADLGLYNISICKDSRILTNKSRVWMRQDRFDICCRQMHSRRMGLLTNIKCKQVFCYFDTLPCTDPRGVHKPADLPNNVYTNNIDL